MSGSRPEQVLDPVCGMTVKVAAAEAAGLTTEYEGKTYAFCRSGCQRAFAEEPAMYAAQAEQARVRSTQGATDRQRSGAGFGRRRVIAIAVDAQVAARWPSTTRMPRGGAAVPWVG
jgi:YHS domain-containing protein